MDLLGLIYMSTGISAFFSFDIDGDVGVDPNHMVLWFSQSGLSLPSKVGCLVHFRSSSDVPPLRNTIAMKLCSPNFRPLLNG